MTCPYEKAYKEVEQQMLIDLCKNLRIIQQSRCDRFGNELGQHNKMYMGGLEPVEVNDASCFIHQ